jgi:D-aminopeptidase
VTAVLPHGGNLFQSKVMGAADVINGFGKSVGLMQIEELGTIETPIVLTNTLNVGIAADALLEVMLNENPGDWHYHRNSQPGCL